MTYKLVCGNNPKILGIEDEGGNWDMEKFESHVVSCHNCSEFTSLLKEVVAKLHKTSQTERR